MAAGKGLVRVLASWLMVSALVWVAPLSQAANDTVYQVFVRSFYDADGDGVGDLKGLRQKLDYLNDGDTGTDSDLEVGILWLMPVFPSADYHGYSVDDYRRIDPEYGSLADFDALVSAAHARGVRIVLDIPFNHTSNQHQWFTSAVNDPSGSPFADYYHLVVGDTPVGDGWHWLNNEAGERVHYFGDFGYNMPDLDLSSDAVRAEVKDIVAFWLNRGVDGFRLDAAKHVFAWHDQLSWSEIQRNNRWWKEFSDFVYSIKPDAVLVGEVLGSEQLIHHFAWGLDGLLDLHFMHKVRAYASSPYSGLIGWWKAYRQHARANNPGFELFPFVASHDENPRLASHLAGHGDAGKEARYRMAMYLLMTVGRYPTLYYGDEIMQAGWKWDGRQPPQGDGSGIYDETLREPFQWYQSGHGPGQTNWFDPRFDKPGDGVSVAEQAGRDDSMYRLVAGLTNFRAEHPGFVDGEIGDVLNDTARWLVFERAAGSHGYLVLINASDLGYDYRFKADWYPRYTGSQLMFWSDGRARSWSDTSDEDKRIDNSVYVPPAGLVILKR